MSAIEDAEALSFYLRNATRDTVHEALFRTFRVRYKRASLCQAQSRLHGLHAKPSKNTMEVLLELWTYPGAEQWSIQRPDMIIDE
jgi:hypothetical protein